MEPDPVRGRLLFFAVIHDGMNQYHAKVVIISKRQT